MSECLCVKLSGIRCTAPADVGHLCLVCSQGCRSVLGNAAPQPHRLDPPTVDSRPSPEGTTRYADCSNLVELIFQTVGTASVCWTAGGVFDDQQACAIATECIQRLRELHPELEPS